MDQSQSAGREEPVPRARFFYARVAITLPHMALCHVHWFSKILGKQIATNVIVPEGAKPPFATFYLLHGLSDDYTIWQRRTRIEAYAEKLPLIIVMPDGFRGFYTNGTSE